MSLHLVISENERDNIVNALAFFNAVFDPKRTDAIPAIIDEWRNVAEDTSINDVDDLATKVATIQ